MANSNQSIKVKKESEITSDQQSRQSPNSWDEAIIDLLWRSKFRKLWLFLIALFFVISLILNIIPEKHKGTVLDYLFEETSAEKYLKALKPINVDDDLEKNMLDIILKEEMNSVVTADLAVNKGLDMLVIVKGGLLKGLDRAKGYLFELGFKDITKVERYQNLKTNIHFNKVRLEHLMLILRDLGFEPPSCNTELPPKTLPGLEGFIEEALASGELSHVDALEFRVFIGLTYGEYIEMCDELPKHQQAIRSITDNDGLIAVADMELETASNKMREYEKVADEYEDGITEATKLLETALISTNEKHAQTKGEEIRQEEAEKALFQLFKEADRSNNLLVVRALSKLRIVAINKVLSSLVNGIQPQDIGKYPDLTVAFVTVGTIATLKEQTNNFRRDGTGLTITALLIEELHQSLLTQYVERMHSFARLRVDILQRRSKAYVNEARLLARFHYLLCRIATGQVEASIALTECHSLKKKDNKKEGSNICKIGEIEIKDCPLLKPMREIPVTERKRAYHALDVFSNLLGVRARAKLYNYQALHVAHKASLENLATFIRFWNKLIVTPLHQFLRETPETLRLDDLVVTISSLARHLNDFALESRDIAEQRLKALNQDTLFDAESFLKSEIEIMKASGSSVEIEDLKIWSNLAKPKSRKHDNNEAASAIDGIESGIKELQLSATELRQVATQLAVRLETSPDSKYFTSQLRRLEIELQELSESSNSLFGVRP